MLTSLCLSANFSGSLVFGRPGLQPRRKASETIGL
jgi:hypothetical protein